MARLLEYGTNPHAGAGLRYRLDQMRLCGDTRTILHPYSCDTEINYRTAASHALIYACWALDLELAICLVQDLHTIIDINTRINDKGILELIIRSGWTNYKAKRMDTAINICRLLIIYFGSKLDAGKPGSALLGVCSQFRHTDVVVYLSALYNTEIDHESMADSIFGCLVTRDTDEAALTYLKLHQDQIQSKVGKAIESTALWGSASMFRHMLTVFQEAITIRDVNEVFGALLRTPAARDWDTKIEIAHGLWSHHLTSTAIEQDLIGIWRWTMLENEEPSVIESLKHMAQVVIDMFMDLIAGRGIQIAMALCCSSQNLELLGRIIDRNLEQIRSKPKLTRHAVIECVASRDIDTFEYMLMKLGSSINPLLGFWCSAGDLEAVTMILEAGLSEAIVGRLPKDLRFACQRGDAELVEIIVKYAGDSIKESDYRSAFRGACYHGHEDVIRVLAANCRDHLNFRTDADILTDMDILADRGRICLGPEIIQLVNNLFGTSIDPTGCSKVVGHKLVCDRGLFVGYNGDGVGSRYAPY